MTGSWKRLLAALLGGTLAVPAAAQQPTGTISGQVVAQGSRAPLQEARVIVIGTNVFASTNTEGRYVLRNVPAGAQSLRILRVGYQEQRRSVNVVAGEATTLDLELTQTVVQLQEVVTTATGQQRRVEIPNSVANLGDVAKNVETKPVTNLADLMVAKSPGVTVLPGNMTGAAPQIRIRGLSSISLSNEPIYVIDGVRMGSGVINVGTGGTTTSYLNTLDPEEIENIEIVKGPAAATLYGTAAANGVVVITTKKGRAGPARWNAHVETGLVQDRNQYLTQYAVWGHTPAAPTTPTRCVLVTIASGACVADSTTSYNVFDTPGVTPLANGNRNSYGLQVNGGTQLVRYFLSGEFENETGPVKMPSFAQGYYAATNQELRDEWLRPEALQRNSFRANVNAAVTPKLDVNVNAGFSQFHQRLPQVDNNTFSFLFNAYNNPGFAADTVRCPSSTAPCLGYTARGLLGEEKAGYGQYSPAQTFQVLRQQDIQRFIGSVNSQWRPFSWMLNDATVGVDLADRNNLSLCRFNECPQSGTTRQGTITQTFTNDRNFTAKINSAGTWQARPSLGFRTTVGAEYVNTSLEFSRAQGQQLPPGAQSTGQAAVQFSNSSLPRADKTLGAYIEEMASVRDRLFITGAVRTDQNSAFGTKFQRVYYPKFGVSYLVSDEAFFPHPGWLNELRLRAAYGASGVQPQSTQALQALSAEGTNIGTSVASTAGTDLAGLIYSALGNPNLKPERSTETEGGFDVRFFNRLSVEFTGYRKLTRDALINKPIAASSGAPGTLQQITNLGSVQNSGLEASVTATLLDTRPFGWDLTVGGSHNSNKVVSLGVDAQGNPIPTIGTGTLRDSVGLPVNGWFFRKYSYADKNNDQIIDASEVTVDPTFSYMGYAYPRDIVSVSNNFNLLNRKLGLAVLLDYKGGFSILNDTKRFYCVNTNTCADETLKSTSLREQARLVAARYKNPSTTVGYLENGQFWRLREVSANIVLPQRLLSRVGAEDASLTLAARNLHVWTNYTGIDPESGYTTLNQNTGVPLDVQTDFSTIAPPTYFIARLNFHF